MPVLYRNFTRHFTWPTDHIYSAHTLSGTLRSLHVRILASAYYGIRDSVLQPRLWFCAGLRRVIRPSVGRIRGPTCMNAGRTCGGRSHAKRGFTHPSLGDQSNQNRMSLTSVFCSLQPGLTMVEEHHACGIAFKPIWSAFRSPD